MCGLAGFIGFENNALLAEKANSIQQHRGPDNQNIWSDSDHISLAHQRLSIIDLSDRANQPFEKNNLVIIFNGEIYNYKELQLKLLQTKDITFRSDSDTEVVLEYYTQYKEKCLEYFIGMFVFVIYDRNTQEVFIARDHFGIKPLFYTRIGEGLAFSSELKSLVHIPGFDKTINFKSLISSLNYLWVSGNDTMFNNCYKLPAAHYMKVSKNLSVTIKKYWEIQDVIVPYAEETIIAKLSGVMESSIKRHMVADVPVSCFLSGGLDSSLISVLAASHNRNLSTYTIGTFAKDKKIEQMPDDQKYAKELATLHNFDHHEIMINADIVKLLPQMVRTLDEPIGDPAAINTFMICDAAKRKGVKVLLSGMGADEIFGGYRKQKATLLALKYQKIPKVIRSIIEGVIKPLPVKIGASGIRFTRWAKKFLSFASLPLEEAYMRSYSYYDRGELSALLKEDHTQSLNALYNEHSEIFNSKFKGDIINQMCHTDIHLFMLGLNLSYTDRASMAASVEVRVPFIDKEVVEFAMSIPGKLKIRKGESKYILKKVAEKFLPHSIIYRPKAPFGAPIRSWISNELSSFVDELLSREVIEKRNIFNYEYIRKMIEDDRRGIVDNAYRIYQLLTIELWFREFIDPTEKI
jgi:asparagine synthase (glutamine-hydrolysing)